VKTRARQSPITNPPVAKKGIRKILAGMSGPLDRRLLMGDPKQPEGQQNHSSRLHQRYGGF